MQAHHYFHPDCPKTRLLGHQCHPHVPRLGTVLIRLSRSSSRRSKMSRPFLDGEVDRATLPGAVDSDDYFFNDPDAFDIDDYDYCVLGAEGVGAMKNRYHLGDACITGVGGVCRVALNESGRAGMTVAKKAGQSLGGTTKRFPDLRKNTAKAVKKTVTKVVGKKNVEKFERSVNELPEGWLARIFWFWEQPFMKIGRLTMFFARLPGVWALALTQFGIFAGQLSLPMLPPLVLGAGMLLRTIWVNANFIFPRIYLIAILLWVTWFANSLVQKTVLHLKRKGTMDAGFATTLITWTECSAILIAGVVILTMLGVKVSGLLLPAGICFALAAKDLSHNFLAGIFLFLVQPFRVGDKVFVKSSAPGGDGMSWWHGSCETVDLRYTTLRKGSYRLFVPNKSFITQQFIVKDRIEKDMGGGEDDHLWESSHALRMDASRIDQGPASRWTETSSEVPFHSASYMRKEDSSHFDHHGSKSDGMREWTNNGNSTTSGKYSTSRQTSASSGQHLMDSELQRDLEVDRGKMGTMDSSEAIHDEYGDRKNGARRSDGEDMKA